MLRTSRHDIDLILHASFNVSHRCSIFTYIFIDVHVLDINQFMGIFLYPAVLIILDQVYRILKYAVTNFRKKIRTITGGPWWTQIKVVLIQKGLLDNQNPGFCMGWPGLHFCWTISINWEQCATGLHSLRTKYIYCVCNTNNKSP